MPAPVRLRTDFSTTELRRLAKKAKDANRSRRLLSLAAVLDGKSRAEAATIGGMDRQTRRDGVHHFNAAGPDGLTDNLTGGVAPRLSAEHCAEFAQIVEAAPIGRRTASYAGGASIFNASSPHDACEAWRKLTAQSETITSIGMREWAHVGQAS